MKQRIIASFLALFVVALALPVFAKEVATSTNRKSSTTMAEIREKIEQRKASSTEKRVEIQQDLAKRRVDHVTKVILGTIERLNKIITRIESRITKIKGVGGITTEVESFVALAKNDLEDAKKAVDAFANLDLSSVKARENFETIRAAVAEAKDDIRSAHQNLMKAVRLLKGPNTGKDKEEKKATTTATTT